MQTNTHFHTLVSQQKIARHTRLHERFLQLEQQLLLKLCIPDARTQWLKDEACCIKQTLAGCTGRAVFSSTNSFGSAASPDRCPSHPTDDAPAGRTWARAASSWRRTRPRWRARSCQMAASSERSMTRPSQPAFAPG